MPGCRSTRRCSTAPADSMRLFVWLARALAFFTLFAFALNNQHAAGVRWFFGYEWRAPMVFIVLAAFALGCALGVFSMVPSWWRHRREARRQPDAGEAASGGLTPPPAATSLEDPLSEPPLRNGL